MSNRMKGNILLFITALVWGVAFVAQKEGADLGGFTFNGIRTFIGGLVLVPFIVKGHKDKTKPLFTKVDIIGGCICGLALFAAGSLQQFGLAYTTAGKAAFITTLYVVFCPFMALLLKKRIRPVIWICIVLDCIGLYLLCMTDSSFRLATGDLLVFLCAIAFAAQMTAIDVWVEKVDGLKLSCIQFLSSGLMGIVCMFIFESPVSVSNILEFSVPILYAGVLSCGIGYTFQTLGQKYADASIAGLILCLESVFGAIAGAILLHESMTGRELLGCVIMFAAVILSNLPEKKKA